MAVNLSPIWGAGAQLLDNSGNVLSGGKIYTYAAGTTTLVTTYTSNTGLTANSNPIVLNAAGRVPYEIWLLDGESYKFVLKDSNDTLIGTWDNLVGINSNYIAYTNEQEIQTATAGQTLFNLTTMQYLPGTNSLSVFVDGVNQYGPGAQYAYQETSPTSITFASGLHVGAEVKFTTSQLQNAGVTDASQISYIPPFSNSVATNVEVKLSEIISVDDFGATGDGVTDDSAAIQTAFDSIPDYTEIYFTSGKTYVVNSQVTIDKPMTIKLLGKIIPTVNANTPGTALFQITSSNVTIDGEGIGRFDGISTSYSNWGAIYASTTTTRLQNVNVNNLTFQNIGIDSTAAAVVNFDGVDNGTMQNNRLNNCGVVSNILGGGFGLYMQFSNNCTISDNTLKYVGSTGINDSAGSGNVIVNNHVSYATLFGFKGGYAPNVTTITADVTPTIYTFTVSATTSAVKNLVAGTAFSVFNSTFPAPVGHISKVVNHGTYLQIFVADSSLEAAPEVGAQLQMLQNGTVYSNNTLFQSGENGWDINGWTNITVTNNTIDAAGSYSDAGVTGGICAGLWLGYDPQGGYNKMKCVGLTINGNTITNSWGSGISLMSTTDQVNISGNSVLRYNRSANNDYGGIEVSRLGYYRSSNISIVNNICVGVANSGYGIYSSFSTTSIIADNQIQSELGICLNSQHSCTVTGNQIQTLSADAAAYGIQTQDASGVNTSSGVTIHDNVVAVNLGTCINNTDANYAVVNIRDTNLTSGAVGYVDFASVTGLIAQIPNNNSGSYSSQVEKKIDLFSTGNSVTFDTVLQTYYNMFMVSVSFDSGSNTGAQGLYLVTSTGTSKYVTTIHALAGCTVSVTGSNQIKVKNDTGGSVTICASLRLMY